MGKKLSMRRGNQGGVENFQDMVTRLYGGGKTK